MLVSAAQALTSAFVPHEYDPKTEAQARDLLATWAYGFSSQVSLDYPGTLMLEVAGSLALFGPWPRLQARLREDLQALGFRHRIAAAPFPLAARALSMNCAGSMPWPAEARLTLPGLRTNTSSRHACAKARRPCSGRGAFTRCAQRVAAPRRPPACGRAGRRPQRARC